MDDEQKDERNQSEFEQQEPQGEDQVLGEVEVAKKEK